MKKRKQSQTGSIRVVVLLLLLILFQQSTLITPSKHKIIQSQTDDIFDSLVKIRRDIHENPELSFEEVRTSKRIADYLSSLALEVHTNIGGTGVVGILHGKADGKIVAWRAEMDAFTMNLPDVVDFKSKVKDVRHICGHDVNTTIGLGIANVLSTIKDSISGTVVFIFQPAEEAFSGAKAMIDDGLFTVIKPDEIYCTHLDDIPVGTIAMKPGPVFTYVEPVFITFKDINTADKDSVINSTNSILTKYSNLDNKLWGKYTDHEIGIFGKNSIYKDFVSFTGRVSVQENGSLLTLETAFIGDNETLLDSLQGKLTEEFRQSALANNFVSVTGPGHSHMPHVHNDPGLTERAKSTISTIYGRNAVITMDGVALPFNDDFAYLQQDIPGGYYILGGSNSEKGIISHPHSPDFAVDEECIAVGVKYFSSMIVERLKNESL